MKYFLVVALITVGSGIWWLSSAGQISFLDEHAHEMEFIDDADSPATVSTAPTEYPEASTSVTYLPPIPEPTNPDGRTRWAAYWEPMTAEEYAVYGPTERTAGPPRVGIQVGHWQRENLPEELSGLTCSSGATAGGYTETEVNLAVAEEVVKLLTLRRRTS